MLISLVLLHAVLQFLLCFPLRLIIVYHLAPELESRVLDEFSIYFAFFTFVCTGEFFLSLGIITILGIQSLLDGLISPV